MNFTSLRRSLAAWMGVSACLIMSACKDKSPSTQGGGSVASAPAAKELNVYMWSEYIDPAIVSDFEKSTGMKVRIDVYEDTETMLARMQHQEGDKLYDVVIASDHVIPTLGSLHLIKPLELARIPNAANVEARFKAPQYDPKGEFSLPYQWGTVGAHLHQGHAGSAPLSWNLVLGPSPAGSFVLIDSMRDMMGVALKLGGHSVNTTDAAYLVSSCEVDSCRKEHKACLKDSEEGGGGEQGRCGDRLVRVVLMGDALQPVALEDPKHCKGCRWRGRSSGLDAMTVTARARNEAGAYAFINTILDAKVGAKLSSWTRYATPNAKAKELLPKKATSNSRPSLLQGGDSQTRVHHRARRRDQAI